MIAGKNKIIKTDVVKDEYLGYRYFIGVGNADQRLSKLDDMDDGAVFTGGGDNERIDGITRWGLWG